MAEPVDKEWRLSWPKIPIPAAPAGVQAFGPFGKHEGKAVARLAALYGCRTSLQGSKSNRKLVMVSLSWGGFGLLVCRQLEKAVPPRALLAPQRLWRSRKHVLQP